jgi:hypothetical protein
VTFVNDEIHGVPHYLTVYPQRTTWSGPEFAQDIRIAGIDFLSAASDEYPYQRQLTKVTKEQLDVSNTPGDNSLEGWWTRSQTDWSGGADQVYFEPASDDLVLRKYYDSAGIDVFNEAGFFSLLPKSSMLDSKNDGARVIVERAGSNGYMYAFDQEINVIINDVKTTVPVGGSSGNKIVNLASAGTEILVSFDNNTTVVLNAVNLNPGDPPIATISGYDGTPEFSYVKNRLLLSVGNKMWELVDWSTNQDVSAMDPLIELPSTNAVIGNAVSTPESILVYANDGNVSSILALKVDDTGALPEMAVPIEVGVMPSTERIRGLGVALGTYVCIVTSLGARIGTVTDGGGVMYGPLIGSPPPSGQTEDGIEYPVHAETYDRFFSYPIADAGDGMPGDAVIDLSVSDDDGRYAWSSFTRYTSDMGSGRHVDSIRLGARRTIHAHSNGTEHEIHEVSDEYGLEPGWLNTSWVRFGTLENKYFDQVKVVCDPPFHGKVAVTALDDEVSGTLVGTLNPQIGQEGVFKINARTGTTDMAIRFDLTPDNDDDSLGPKVAAWSLRAWPSVKGRGEQVVIPLLCFDNEVDSLGVNVGYTGYAKERWEALSAALTGGTSVLVHEVNSGFSYNAIGEDATFTQTAPGNNASGFGGILQVVLRKT